MSVLRDERPFSQDFRAGWRTFDFFQRNLRGLVARHTAEHSLDTGRHAVHHVPNMLGTYVLNSVMGCYVTIGRVVGPLPPTVYLGATVGQLAIRFVQPAMTDTYDVGLTAGAAASTDCFTIAYDVATKAATGVTIHMVSTVSSFHMTSFPVGAVAAGEPAWCAGFTLEIRDYPTPIESR
jgi:hypothetical protein